MGLSPPIMWKEGRIFTLDRGPGRSVYGESIIVVNGNSYREWVPWRSKLSALIKKTDMTFPGKGNILYLGAAQGTTVSHISDIMEEGTIYAVEFSETAFRKLTYLARERNNIVPILEDAFHPERFKMVVPPVDILYQDVSQKEQLKLFLLNLRTFLKRGGLGILMLKSRSVDVTARPADIYREVSTGLKENNLDIEVFIELDPFSVDHAAFVVKRK
ncbi:MAG: fibrillarin-like rRNA/tRNA 2'-O-methyltransferase [Candidatus Thermoplasmatota archaeon]|nr:fibrillarin-like rRNA/tRNA 2'-O-methyltransferase [Candidatus Thermoplasmatota archaeon]